MLIESEFWEQHSLTNHLQSLLLFFVMIVFLSLLGWLLLGSDGIFLLLLLGVILLVFNPVSSPWLIMRLYHATPLTHHQAPQLNLALTELARRSGLERVPTLFYIPSSMINAFTVGNRNEAAIAVSDGLLKTLNYRELIGVLAHEVSHVRNNDIWVMSIADLISRLTSFLSLLGQFFLLLNLPLILLSNVSINWFAIFLLVFAPNLSSLAQLGLSRVREYNADLGAARLTADPGGLASALVKIGQYSGSFFEKIMMPGRRIPVPSLLRTHPLTEERVRRLMALDPTTFPPLESHDLSYKVNSRHLVNHKPRWHINGLWH
ncbi:MAG: zinc metalloprotease HtpX [Gammaproteobacteria bacterium]|nr:zinc metalloprotease HtpX [Gammaproteobacteria bacterium]